MAKLKAPVFSLAAQGKLGPIHLSHHNGATYGYATREYELPPPTTLQEDIRQDFHDGAERWMTFTPAEKWFWTQVAPHLYRPSGKDCKKARLTGYQTYMSFWREMGPTPDKFAFFLLIWIYIAFKYAIALPF